MEHIKKSQRTRVLLGLFGLQAGFTGIGINCISVLFAAILKDTGFLAGEFSLYYTITAFAAAVGVAPLTKLFFRRNGRWLLALLGAIAALGIGAMSFFTQLWQWYLVAIAAGLAGCLCPVVVPVIATNWFEAQKGFVNGIVMAASGIVGIVCSPICSLLIEGFGWRVTALVLMVVLFVLVVCSSLFLIRVAPSQPSASCGRQEALKTSPGAKPPHRFAEKTSPYLLCGVMLSLLAPKILVQFCIQIPVFAGSLGYSAVIGGVLTSFLMCGNIGGKLLFGILLDKLGIYRVTIVVYCFTAASFALLFAGGRSLLCACLGAVLLGLIYSVATIGASMLCLDLYGPERYQEQLAKLSTIPMVLAAFSGPAIAFVYDQTGTYNAVLWAGAICCPAMAVITAAIGKRKQKFRCERKQLRADVS